MELKKCARCGCFYSSNDSVCSACLIKDKQDINNLNNYIGNSPYVESIDSLSFGTGISVKNISRIINNKSINNLFE